ncbi:CapA family protein [Salipaludibacillus aurantiacus]|uniref:Poly-gamma-glutamate synthesis protein (Capsule biosynthesis protein) n=1 Tax=Salipaludibacillus aurantiacus TaxID=1601833 RepID=A0A1H9X6Q7_9BACI|nr:CapA family protein [Salipaludibacillus aurantiacus]SES41323.1 poly-gamma-glutamate synthesis protein (capsule biosynthesis protein) [Salipaludibacillus aurantiacus]
MDQQNRPFTLKEKHLNTIKKHKKRSVKDSLIALAVCIAIIASYQLMSHTYSSGAPSEPQDPSADDSLLSVSMVGDIMLGRGVEKVTSRHGLDYPFEHAAPLFEQTDVVTGNFEHPVLVHNEEAYEEDKLDKSILLHAGTEAVEAVKNAGFTTINLANNHMADYGSAGLFDTLDVFKEADIPTVGAGINLDDAREIAYEDVNDLTVATLGFNDAYMPNEDRTASLYKEGVTPLDPEYVIPDIKEAADNADFVMVHVHWGEEYDSSVHPRQREMAHAMVEAGADLIIGHHAHVLQPIEIHEEAVIAYGLGNFVFDQGWSMTRETAILQYRLFEESIQLEVHPMYIEESQPRQVTSRYREEKIYSQMTGDVLFGQNFNDEWQREDGKLVREIERQAGK